VPKNRPPPPAQNPAVQSDRHQKPSQNPESKNRPTGAPKIKPRAVSWVQPRIFHAGTIGSECCNSTLTNQHAKSRRRSGRSRCPPPHFNVDPPRSDAPCRSSGPITSAGHQRESPRATQLIANSNPECNARGRCPANTAKHHRAKFATTPIRTHSSSPSFSDNPPSEHDHGRPTTRPMGTAKRRPGRISSPSSTSRQKRIRPARTGRAHPNTQQDAEYWGNQSAYATHGRVTAHARASKPG